MQFYNDKNFESADFKAMFDGDGNNRTQHCARALKLE